MHDAPFVVQEDVSYTRRTLSTRMISCNDDSSYS
jgi:hypothetical protein